MSAFSRACVLGLAVALLSGCAERRKKGPCAAEALDTSVPVVIHASTRLNRDLEARSLPTHVRLYTVKDVTEARSVTFDAIWKDGDKALPNTLLASQSLAVQPGETVEVDLTRIPEGQYMIAAGIFRQPAGTSWRAIHRLPPAPRCMGRRRTKWPKPTPTVHVILEDNRIRASEDPPKPPAQSAKPREPAPPPEETLANPGGNER